jgi:hypothetical protein
MGYLVGHIYYFFKETYPATRDHPIFFAPQFLQVSRYRTVGVGVADVTTPSSSPRGFSRSADVEL